MALYMYQACYTADSWAAQVSDPQNRVEEVGKAVCESVGGKLVGGWYAFGDYDIVLIFDVPDNVTAGAIALRIASGGAISSAKTTVLMSGEDGVATLQKAGSISSYTPKK